MLKSTARTLLPLIMLFACSGDDGTTDTAAETSDTSSNSECMEGMEITSDITADTTWDCNVTLGAIVTVTNGATLTVTPGVTVSGKSGSALVIAQGSKMMAEGTAEMPIVFTSSQPAGMRNRGNWGGILFLGNAPINLAGGTGLAEGLENNATYGGTDPAYSCGALKYVRVEFAGFELTTDNELNGITFSGCGTGTTVDYVQVHMGDDDGIEWFGGGMDASHLVLTGIADDSLDIDQGYSGTIEHVFIQQDPAEGNYAFEISNQDTNLDATPRTNPVLSHVTAIGGNGPKAAAIKLKEGTAGELHNSIVMNFGGAQVDLTETQTEMQAAAGAIKIMNTIFMNNNQSGSGLYVSSPDSTFDIEAFVEDPANSNMFEVDPMLTAVTWGSPNIVPMAGSPALLGTGEHLGAVKDDAGDWTKGWTNYAQN